MTEVSVHRDPSVIGFQKSILDSAGIACFIRNEHTAASLGAGFMGLVQSQLFDPVLCIVDDDRYQEALELIQSATAPAETDRGEWKCPHCGETIPGTFAACWNCTQGTEAADDVHLR